MDECDKLFYYSICNSYEEYYDYSDKDKCDMIKIQQLMAHCAQRLD